MTDIQHPRQNDPARRPWVVVVEVALLLSCVGIGLALILGYGSHPWWIRWPYVAALVFVIIGPSRFERLHFHAATAGFVLIFYAGLASVFAFKGDWWMVASGLFFIVLYTWQDAKHRIRYGYWP